MNDLAAHLETLQTALSLEHSQAPGLFGEIARMEGLLADTYRNRVPYELLQNSDDAGACIVEIDELDDGRFRWSNDGRPLNTADIESLCRSASSTKQRGGESIGYRGIGFKSLAAVADRIEVRSAGVVFNFDRNRSAEVLGETDPAQVPLIRIPTGIRREQSDGGVSFTVTRQDGAAPRLADIDLISALFLRNIEHITVRSNGRETTTRIERDARSAVLHDVDGEASFTLLRNGEATVAVPLNARALALTGVRGRLACFLPLNDEVGVPVIVSGDLLTDPSRTHAIVADDSSRQVLIDAAAAIADALCAPDHVVFNRLWELILQGEDIRSPLVAPTQTVSKVLLTALRDAMSERRPTFAYSPVPLEPEDVPAVFPQGAPVALYAERNLSSARAARTVLSLRTLDFASMLDAPEPPQLSDPSRARLGNHLGQLARAHGRQLSHGERELVESVAEPLPEPVTELQVTRVIRAETTAPATLPDVLTRWRAAEVATMEYLNGRGWHLRDVSGQNVGYDLEGTNPNGTPVHLEVKKVERPDARFSMTNNELSLMLNSPSGYLVALLVGDGRHARLMLLDPTERDLPRERVCRRWEWEFTDWARSATLVD